MRRRRHRIPHVLVLALVTAALLGTPDALWASHYAWLGHDGDTPPNARLLGVFVPTIYRILDEATPEWSGEQATEPLRRPDGSVIATIGPKLKRQLDLEGSLRLRDGRIVNVEEKVREVPLSRRSERPLRCRDARL